MPLAQQIRELIEERGLQAGARLPSERKLSVELGVSRSSLREAIQQLISRGVVTSRHGGGTFVADSRATLHLENMMKPFVPLVRNGTGYWRDVMEIRKSLDADAAYYAAMRASNDDRERLKAALDAVSDADIADAAVHAQADAHFHMVIAEASHNAVLWQVIAGLSGLLMQSITESLTVLHRVPGTVKALDDQHGLILHAILEGRPDDARKAAFDHLVFVEDKLRLVEEETARERRSIAFRRIPVQRKP